MFSKKIIFSIISFFILASSPVLAENLPFSYKTTLKVTALSHELTESVRTDIYDIKTKAAIEMLGQIQETVNEHFDDFQILEAYTLKPDGQKLHVPQDKILISGLPNAPEMSIFEADSKTRTIVFSDVSVGDQLYLSVKYRDKKKIIPGGFLIASSFPPHVPTHEAELVLDIPESLKIHKEIIGFSEKKSLQNGRTVYTWVKEPQAYRPSESTAPDSFDKDPHVLVSSYPDNETIGKFFFNNAAPKSVPTQAIRLLAEQITENKTDRYAQAEAIYDWVTKNIRYLGINLGYGGMIPREAETILTTKYGDCKDFVTLMRALLAAKGINSDYALINAGSPTYKRWSVPGSNYDHVILYLPEFDLYTDPTSKYFSFQHLPSEEYGKPILRMGENGILLTSIPVAKAEMNRIINTIDITFRADGTPTGTSTLEATGSTAGILRSMVADSQEGDPHVFMKELLKQGGFYGSGSIENKDPMDHKEPYTVKTTFDLTNTFFGETPRHTILSLEPRFSPMTYPMAYLLSAGKENFLCSSGMYTSILNIHLPKGIRLKNLPPKRNIQEPLASYTAQVTTKGRTIRIERNLVLTPPGPVCTPDIALTLKKVLLPFHDDQLTPPAFGKNKA